MRYFCLLATLLISVVDSAAAKDSEIKRNDSGTLDPDHSAGHNRFTSTDARRAGVHQVGYFELSGDNYADNEFLSKGVRDSELTEEEKKNEAWASSDDQAVRSDSNHQNYDGWYENSNEMVGDSNKLELSADNDGGRGPKTYGYRTERHVKRYDSRDDPLALSNSMQVNKNPINLWRWSKKNSEAMTDVSLPNGIQKNEAYPVNDDVADFAVFMSKAKKKRMQSNNYFDKNGSTVDDDETAEDVVGDDKFRKSDSASCRRVDNSYSHLNIPSGDHSKLFKKDLTSNNGNTISQAIRADPKKADDVDTFLQYPNPTTRHHGVRASLDENIGDILEWGDRIGGSSSVVGDSIVREKPIILPEPLIFNSSHVVSSFVYTMIPFRSPLLNLLESDKHSKYIMIKIDPVLQPSKSINLDRKLIAGNIENVLEKNMMNVLNKLISSESPPDHESVEGIPRSKQTTKPISSRFFRNVDREHGSETGLFISALKRLGGAIS